MNFAGSYREPISKPGTQSQAESAGAPTISLPLLPDHIFRQYESLLAKIGAFGKGETRKCLGITSVSSGEGVTTVSSQLALSAARSRKKVLLIDANAIDPSIHLAFGIPNRCGLTNYFNDRDRFNSIHSTENRYLYIIPWGSERADAHQWQQQQNWLLDLSYDFDLTILDLPPIFGGLNQIRSLACSVPMVMVIEANASKTMQVEGLKLLQQWGTRPVGVIRNQIQI